MNEKLTDQEEALLQELDATGNHEGLLQEIGTIIGCAVLILGGFLYSSSKLVLIGVIIYPIIRIKMALKSDSKSARIRDAVKKLRSQNQSDTSTNPSGPVR